MEHLRKEFTKYTHNPSFIESLAMSEHDLHL